MELVLQKLQLHEILDKEVAWLNTLKSENIGKVIRGKPRSKSDTGCVSYGNYHLRTEIPDHAEETPISISLQSQSEVYESIASISSNCGPVHDHLETSAICNTACKSSTLPEKLNNTLSNIWKIKDKNACNIVVHQCGVTKKKADANKKNRRKSGLSSNSNKAVEVESVMGTSNLKKKKIKEITEVVVENVKIPNTEYNHTPMEMSDVGKSKEKLKQPDSLKQKFLFTEDLPCKVADDSIYMQACITVNNIMGEAPNNKRTPSPSKLSSCTFQKLQKFKRPISNTDSVSQSIPEVKGNLIQTEETLDCKKDSSTKRINSKFRSLNDLVNYGRKLSSSQQSSNSGSIPSNENASEVSLNNPHVFSAEGDNDLVYLDFDM